MEYLMQYGLITGSKKSWVSNIQHFFYFIEIIKSFELFSEQQVKSENTSLINLFVFTWCFEKVHVPEKVRGKNFDDLELVGGWLGNKIWLVAGQFFLFNYSSTTTMFQLYNITQHFKKGCNTFQLYKNIFKLGF